MCVHSHDLTQRKYKETTPSSPGGDSVMSLWSFPIPQGAPHYI